MGWVRDESFWFLCPYFADVFEGREALEGFEPPPIIIGVDEVVKVGVELPMAFVMIAFDGGVLDRPVHAFHLAIGPGMLDFGEAVLDPVFFASHVEHMGDVRGCRADVDVKVAAASNDAMTSGSGVGSWLARRRGSHLVAATSVGGRRP